MTYLQRVGSTRCAATPGSRTGPYLAARLP